MTIDQLAEIARNKKQSFIDARAAAADFDTLKRIGAEYSDAIAAWHKEKWPNKKFNKPSVGYLIRAL